MCILVQVSLEGAVIRDDDDDARMMPINAKFTQDFDSSGTQVASVDVPIAEDNVGCAISCYTAPAVAVAGAIAPHSAGIGCCNALGGPAQALARKEPVQSRCCMEEMVCVCV